MNIKVIDELDGISSVFKMYESKDVVMFYIDLNTSLKYKEPVYYNNSVMWLEKRGEASVSFGSRFARWDVTMRVSKYSCYVTFYKHSLLSKAIKKKPLYSS